MSNTLWPTISFDLAPRDAAGLPIQRTDLTPRDGTGSDLEGGGNGIPIDLLEVFTGPTGPQGPPYTPTEFSEVAGADGAQTLTLPAPALTSGELFINGLYQVTSAYSVSGTTLSLPADLCIVTGDLIAFVYPT